jgi:pyrroline-5-carboxylate reductase
MQLGFIGTGNITTLVVEGLCSAGIPGLNILLSPRNAAKASRLAGMYSGVEIAENNQSVLEECDTIVLALRPQVAESVLRDLKFRADQKIISLIAIIPINLLADVTSPARDICRAVPLPSVAQRHGPILIYPDQTYANNIFSNIGTPFAVVDERRLELLWAVTGLICPFYALLETTSNWAVGAGLDSRTAERFTAAMYAALSQQVMQTPEIDFADLVKDSATPGGLNEQALEIIRSKGAYSAFETALDAIADRLGLKIDGNDG